MTLQDIVQLLRKSDGFVIFTGVLNRETGKLDFNYLRQQYNLEDLDQLFREFKSALDNDLNKSRETLNDTIKAIEESKLNQVPQGNIDNLEPPMDLLP